MWKIYFKPKPSKWWWWIESCMWTPFNQCWIVCFRLVFAEKMNSHCFFFFVLPFAHFYHCNNPLFIFTFIQSNGSISLRWTFYIFFELLSKWKYFCLQIRIKLKQGDQTPIQSTAFLHYVMRVGKRNWHSEKWELVWKSRN